MRKRIFVLWLGILACLLPGHAVLKERDLARTLGVLKAELQSTYERQQAFMAIYEQQGTQQHMQLVQYMQQCEQIGLMLYSQSQDNTFDMAYACQQASDLYRSLGGNNNKLLQYDRIITNLNREVERLDALIASLKSMPPILVSDGDSVLTAGDSLLLQAIDSLSEVGDSLMKLRYTTPADGENLDKDDTEPDDGSEGQEGGPGVPLYLTGQQLSDRADCLEYAQTLHDNMQDFLQRLGKESAYYASVREKVERLNNFAQRRYKILQDKIFRTGGMNYFRILSTLPRQLSSAQRSLKNKYSPLKGHSIHYSEWRGLSVLYISVFIILYLSVALALSYLALRLLLRGKWRTPEYRLKLRMLTTVVGIALFAVIVMVVRTSIDRNFVRMGTELIINFAWLLEIIFLSLYIRLRGDIMHHAALAYMPLIVMAFIVILFRIVLIPDAVINLIFPPILLLCSLWQMHMAARHRSELPTLDIMYINATTAFIVITCLTSWMGFTLLAVQIMIWWTFQLAAVMTITCLYDLMEMVENRYMIFRIAPELRQRQEAGEDCSAEVEALSAEMKAGKYFGKTWVYDLVNTVLVPILAVISVPFSIYYAAEVFEMTSLCRLIFFKDLVDVKDLIRISLFKACIVAAMWFIFRYVNYGIRSIYSHYRQQLLTPGQTLNLTLSRNVIGILVWGLYFIIVLVILHVPKSGISLVTAGLATGLGFAMQDLIENFFYGISLMAGRLHVGDFIECDGIQGKVESITYQSTQVITPDGCVIAFLNKALFSKNFKNMTRNHRYELIKIPVGVAYGTDVELVRKLIVEAVTPACKAKDKEGHYVTNIRQVPVTVAFVDFGDSSVDLAVCIWMRVEDKIVLTSRVKELIYNTLNENNIEIPFPQRDVHIKN